MAVVGSKARPAILRVQSEERAQEVTTICAGYGIQFILGIESNKPENLFDLKKAIKALPPKLAVTAGKVSPNDYCPCGSNKKLFKRSIDGFWRCAVDNSYGTSLLRE